MVFLAGEESVNTENSQLAIHNPWGFAGGDADDVQKYADPSFRKEEDHLAEFYASKTGQPVEVLKAMMSEETYMNAEEAMRKDLPPQRLSRSRQWH